MEAYAKSHGVKKAYLLEEALRCHLEVLREIPADLIIPSRLVLTNEAMAQIAEGVSEKSQPTEALRVLFRE